MYLSFSKLTFPSNNSFIGYLNVDKIEKEIQKLPIVRVFAIPTYKAHESLDERYLVLLI